MQYIYYAVTPPKTTAANPHITNCTLTYGYLTSIVFILPKGCYGLLGVQLYQQSDLVFPANPNNWLTGDGLEQRFEEMIDLTSGLPAIQIATYNLDDTYTHTAELIFTITSPASGPPIATGGGSVDGGGGGGGGDISPLPEPTPTPTPTCETGYHLENGICVKDVTPPPTPTPTVVKISIPVMELLL